MKAKKKLRLETVLVGVLWLAASTAQAAVLDEVVYGHINTSNAFEIYRNDGTTMQKTAGPNNPPAGVDAGIFGMLGTVDGNVVVGRTYSGAFDLLSYDGDTLAEVARSNSLAGIDDGLFGMVAAADGTVVVARTYDPGGPGSGTPLGFDLLRFELDPVPGNPAANIVDLNRSAPNADTVNDGPFGMVPTTGGDVVMIRQSAG